MSTSDREVAAIPERIYLNEMISFWYEDFDQDLHGIEYVRKDVVDAALTTARREQAERDAVIVEGYKGDLAPPIVVRVAIAAAIRAGAKEGK